VINVNLKCCTTADFLMVLAEHMKAASPEEVRGFREAWIAGAERQAEETRKMRAKRLGETQTVRLVEYDSENGWRAREIE
jgi:hypothetical protein